MHHTCNSCKKPHLHVAKDYQIARRFATNITMLICLPFFKYWLYSTMCHMNSIFFLSATYYIGTDKIQLFSQDNSLDYKEHGLFEEKLDINLFQRVIIPKKQQLFWYIFKWWLFKSCIFFFLLPPFINYIPQKNSVQLS